MMKKLALAIALVGTVALAAGTAYAQGRGGGGGGGGGMRGGGSGSWSGGSAGGWHGGGSGGGWSNGGWRGGGWNGSGWRGGGWNGSGWRGGWWGPNVGIVVGAPGFWGWGGGWGWGPGWGWGAWPSTFTASFPVVVSNTVDTGVSGTFIQSPPQAAPNPANFWYYCTDPAGYFPYVQNCSKPWMQVVPQNVPGSPAAPAMQ